MGRKSQRRFRTVAIACATLVVAFVGLLYARYVLQEFSHRPLPILMYHRIVPDSIAASRYDLPVSRFREHLDYLLKQGYTPISPELLLKPDASRAELPERPVIITFDDGTIDHFELVLSILEAKGLVAAFFIVTSVIGQGGYLDFHHLDSLRAAGMVIGSHSHSHVYAPSLRELDDAHAVFELRESKRILDDSLSQQTRFLAIPGGWYGERTIEIADSLGYTYVLTSDVGSNRSAPLGTVLERLEIDGHATQRTLAWVLSPYGVALTKLIWKGKRLAYALIGPRLYETVGALTRRQRSMLVTLCISLLSGFAVYRYRSSSHSSSRHPLNHG